MTLAFKKLASLDAIGIISICVFVLGYIFFAFLKIYYVEHLENVADHASIQGFECYRYVYYGNKDLSSLALYELEDIKRVLNTRTLDFNKCFPKANSNDLLKQVDSMLSTHSPSTVKSDLRK